MAPPRDGGRYGAVADTGGGGGSGGMGRDCGGRGGTVDQPTAACG